jgi:beta-aspartyl-peptidase (threonine type)
MELCDPREMVVERELRLWEARRRETVVSEGGGSRAAAADTVGAVAMDSRGNLAAGNSTGGTPFKHPGRVGDSPLIGCGVYADNRLGGAACTGWGEAITRVVLAKSALDLLREIGSVQEAAAGAIRLLQERVEGRGGVILVDSHGDVGYAFNTASMAHGYLKEGMSEPLVSV